MFKRLISILLILTFCNETFMVSPAIALEGNIQLPVAGSMVNLSPAFEPVLIKGLTIHKENPFLFDFIVDTGNSGLSLETQHAASLRKESERLIKYFFACLTIPENDLWVNLSPYEKQRMVPEALGQTALGRDLLAQDYILKQLTASLIYPERELGKEFWNRVYAKAQAMYGPNVQIPVNTFNKVWILADKASVHERGQSVFVVDGHLKVMLEEDYLAVDKSLQPTRGYVQNKINRNVSPSTLPSDVVLNTKAPQGNPVNAIGSQIIRDIILPEIEKEVNEGKNFATLRQIFNSLILATWYKNNLKDSILNQLYSDKNIVKGINLSDSSIKEKIYQQYLQAYKKGVFNYIKDDPQASGQNIPRKYFSGGFGAKKGFLSKISSAKAHHPTGRDYVMKVGLDVQGSANLFDQAQIARALHSLRVFLMGSIVASGAISNLATGYQQPVIQETSENLSDHPLKTPNGNIHIFPSLHASNKSREKLEKALKTFDEFYKQQNKDRKQFTEAAKVAIGAIDQFLNDNSYVLEDQKKQVPDLIGKITNNHIKYLSPEGVPVEMDGVTMQEMIMKANNEYTKLEEQLEPLKNLGWKGSVLNVYSLSRGTIAFLCRTYGDFLIQQEVEIFPVDLLMWGNMGEKMEVEFMMYGFTEEEAQNESLQLKGDARNRFTAFRVNNGSQWNRITHKNVSFEPPLGNKDIIIGNGHTVTQLEENSPKVKTTLQGEIKRQQLRPNSEIDSTIELDRDVLMLQLNADPVFKYLYGEVTKEDLTNWSRNGTVYQPLIEIIKEDTLGPMTKLSKLSKDPKTIADPSNLKFIFFNSPKNNEFGIKKGNLFVYRVGSRVYVLVPLDAFQENVNDAHKMTFLLKCALLALVDQDKGLTLLEQEIKAMRMFRDMLLKYDPNSSRRTIEVYQELAARFQSLDNNIKSIEEYIDWSFTKVDVSKLRYYESKRDEEDPKIIVVQLFDPQTVNQDGKATFINVKIVEGEAPVVKEELGQISNPAMISEDREEMSQLLRVTETSPGGIDLNTTDMGMAVTKDGSGVDMSAFGGNPAMLERIKAQGIFSAEPIIIEITPVTALMYE